MDRHVEQIAGAGQFAILAPTPARLGPIEKALAAKVPRLAQGAAGDQVLDIAHGRREAISKRRHVHHAVVAGRVIHFAHFAGVESQRLFAHHVLAVAGRGHGDRPVSLVGRGDDHRVDVRIVAHRVRIGRDFVDAPVAFALFQQLGVGIAGGDQFGPSVEPQAGHVVIFTDRAGADDSNANGKLGGRWIHDRPKVRAASRPLKSCHAFQIVAAAAQSGTIHGPTAPAPAPNGGWRTIKDQAATISPLPREGGWNLTFKGENS